MELNLASTCDVLVLGLGIAGISVASAAAGSGALVIPVCRGRLFSGSSFYPGTQSLGLVGLTDEVDEVGLTSTIEDVGCGMADDVLVRAFVKGIHPVIEKVRSTGIRPREADKDGQQKYVPCFDHKRQDWNGIEFGNAREIFSQRLERLGVTILSGRETLELVRADGRACGAVITDGMELYHLGCKALALVMGDYGSPLRHHLCISDVEGLGQALALEAGCRPVNMEFMQIMPGYLLPAYQTIFNEKTFRSADPHRPDGAPLLEGETVSLLELRVTHGPFTARLPPKVADLAIHRACLEDKRGARVAYSDEMRHSPPELVKTYFN